ncbi:MAG TPA: YCF48-related protein [Tahibacter sp.]|uniref:WD40/YVTN/BNR-like repeat-containing protein n=1 Tax=Tahibacter sp. TaxID=2056211 RepID=UPI002CBE26F9|nr:YCF48-related protein [Tahibacter sp.]HSX61980.1 YCF48-related protein [Tahibacter sp.]
MGRGLQESLNAAPRLWRSVLWSSLLVSGLALAQQSAAPEAANAPAAEPASGAPAAAAADAAPMAKAAPGVAWPEPARSAAELMPLATQSLLLDLVESGNRAIAVGERGAVVVSDDRSTWRQIADVPTRATLTAAASVGSKVWAVGRDGVILASEDAGEHWKVQRSDPWKPATDASAGDNARHGAPLLDVVFLDESRGFAVGAYSLFLETADGGLTWNERQILTAAAPAATAAAAGSGEKWTFSKEELKIEDESEPHFNAIARTSDGSLLIAGERGSLLRSRDNGANWQRMKLPYDGSMFGAIGFEGQRAIVFGLRGHAFETENLGDTWREVATDTELSLLGGVKLAGGGVALVGANGIVLVRRSATEPLRAGAIDPAGALAAVLPIEGGAAFLVAGENGVARFRPR